RAPQAAAVIHSDFERGFIRAETIAYDDYVALGGESGAQQAGKMRLEGKSYVVADGDVLHFRFATLADDGGGRTSHLLTALADRAEMLVDAEHDQHELGDDARENHADHHSDQAGDDPEQTAERTERHQGEPGDDAGEAEQDRNADCEPIEDLDDRRRDEPFPLEQVAIIEHGLPPPDTRGAASDAVRAADCAFVQASELAARTHEHCTAASRWSIERSPTSVVNAGLIGAHECLGAVPVDRTAGGV